MKTTIRQLGCALLILASGAALAAEPEQCRTVRLGTVNWTDVVASSAVAEALLDGLGYQVKQTSASQQIVLAAWQTSSWTCSSATGNRPCSRSPGLTWTKAGSK